MNKIPSAMLVCALVLAQSPFTHAMSRQTTPADNTKMNKRDSGTAAPTADQQKNNRSDVEITRLIRRAVTEDKSLSTYAKNVKIITQNGMVTLRGPVRSEDERKSIESKANDVAGANHVKNELEIAAKKPGKKT